MQEIKLNVNQSKGYEGVVLPKVTTNEEGKKLVSARELHESLNVKERFSKWFERMVSYGFTLHDFTPYQMVHPQNKQTIEDYALTLDMAKHIAMIQRSEIGMKIRNYFDNFDKVELIERDGVVLVSSRVIAKDFNKQHKHVLDTIGNLIRELGYAENSANLFIETMYQHEQNKQWYKEYLLTRDGFSLLVMGFTGKEALQWKLKYIEAFNKMEQHIKELHQPIKQKERLLLQLFSDDKIEVANAHKQLLELETKPLIKKIELQEPMVDSFKTYLDTEGTTTVTEACKRFGLKRATVFEHLRNNGLVYKNKVEATVKGIEKGYFKQVVKNGYPTMVVLPKGVEYIKTLKDTPLIENGIKKLKGYENC